MKRTVEQLNTKEYIKTVIEIGKLDTNEEIEEYCKQHNLDYEDTECYDWAWRIV